jgi:hypothetical protein
MKDHNVAERYRTLVLDIAATTALLSMTGMLAWVWGG